MWVARTIAATLGMVLIAVACQGRSGVHEDLRPPGSPGVAHTLEDLLTEPDLIAVATVVDSHPGRVVGQTATDPGVAFRETALRIDEVWAGNLGVGDTLVVETERGASPYDRTWWNQDTRVVAFLWLKRDAESAGRFYRPIVPQAVFLLDGDRLVPAADGDLAAEAAALGPARLRDAVAQRRMGS